MGAGFVQSNTTTAGAVASISPVFSSAPVATHLLVAIVAIGGTASRTVTGVSSAAGTSWQKAAGYGNATLVSDIEVWYAENCEGGATDETVAITLSAAPSVGSMAWILEASGMQISSVLDKVNGSNTSLTPGSTTPTDANELWIAAAINFANALTNPAGWSSLTALTEGSLHGFASYLIESGSGAENPTFGGTADDPASIIVSFIPANPPSTPTGLGATVSGENVDLSWTAGSGGGPVSSYTILRGTSSGGETSYATGIATTSYVDTGATPGTEYYYKVEAVGPGGTSSASTEVNATVPLSAPTGVFAINGSAIAIGWTAVGGATSYTLLRGTSSGGETSYVTGITGTTYSDSSVTPGVTYFYEVEAVSGGGTSAASAEVSAEAFASGYLGLAFQLAFENNPFDATSGLVWTTVKPRTIDTTTGRARPLDRISAGTCRAVFDDRDGHFTPWNTNSPHYSSNPGYGLVPGKPTRWLANNAGTIEPMWWGYSSGWLPVPTDALNQDCNFTANDLLYLLNLRYLANPTLYTDLILQSSPNAFFRLADTLTPQPGYLTPMDSSGTGAGASILSGTGANAISSGVQGPILYDPATCINFAGGTSTTTPAGMITVTPSGSHQALTGSFQFSTTVQGVVQYLAAPTFDASNNYVSQICITTGGYLELLVGTAGSTLTVELVGGLVNDGGFHTVQWTLSASGGTLTVLLDNVNIGSFANASLLPNVNAFCANYQTSISPTDGFAGLMANIALFPTVLSSAVLTAQYEAATYFQNVELTGARLEKCLIVALGAAAYANLVTNINPGTIYCLSETSQTLQTTALSYMQNVVDTEYGIMFQGPDGTFNFYQRNYPQTNASSITSQATYADNSSTSYHYITKNLKVGLDDLELYTHVQVMITTAASSLTATGTPTSTTAPTLFESANTTTDNYYSTRVLQRSANISASSADAQILCALMDSQIAEVLPQRGRPMAFTLHSGTQANLPQMVTRRIWDRFTFQRQGPGESQFDQDSLLESMAFSFKADPGELSATWGGNPYPLIVPQLSISHIGNWSTATIGPTLTVDPVNLGDLMILWLIGSPVYTPPTGGGVDNWIVEPYFSNTLAGQLAWGLVTTVGSQVLTVPFNVDFLMVDEFSNGSDAATWVMDPVGQGTSTNNTGGSLTPTTTLGELGYWGFYDGDGGLSAGSTPGFTYEEGPNSKLFVAYDTNVTAVAAPVMAGGPSTISVGALFQAIV